MIRKEFIAEAAQKIMAANVAELPANAIAENDELLKDYAKGAVKVANILADTLEEDFYNTEPDGGLKKYSDNENFFDNYVNWTKNL